MTSPLSAPKVLLFGPSGAGKTHSLRTLADAGLEVFIVMTDSHGRTVLNDVPDPKVHWHFVPPRTGTFSETADAIKKATMASWDFLQKQTTDPKKANYTGLLEIYETLHNFKCDRCGKEFGDVSTWGTGRAIVLDHFSSINQMAMQVFAGLSVMRSQPQWGAAMNTELTLAHKLCNDARCTFVLIAHVDRQIDQVFGGVHLVPLALGQKVAPDLPREFSDVIFAQHEGKDFFWSTAMANADLKAINIETASKLPPSFIPLIDGWKAKGGLIEEAA